MNNTAQAPYPSFYNLIKNNRQYSLLLCTAAGIIVIQFVFFKYLFPYANYMPDSFSYLRAAYTNEPVNTWPVGYSLFLRLVSVFTRSDTVLVFIQYLLLQGAIVYFLLLQHLIVQSSKVLLYGLMAFFVVNPVPLIISNYISADALFTALSLIWLIQLILLLVQPSARYLWWQAFLLAGMFIIRYNALYYPFIALLVIVIARLPVHLKLKGIGVMFILLGLVIANNLYEYKKLTGKAQFSAFGGWQLASNALFMYSRLPRDTAAPPAQFVRLQRLVDKHISALKKIPVNRPDSALGIYYLWKGPLRKYLGMYDDVDSTAGYLKKWSAIAPFYQSYGAYMIGRHPGAFAQYFLLPNTINYLVPPDEFLIQYNMQRDSVEKIAQDWFRYKSKRVTAKYKKLPWVMAYSIAHTLFNIVFIGGLLSFVLLKGYRKSTAVFNRWVLLTAVVAGLNFMFSVAASPVVFRYQLFVFVLLGSMGVLLVDFIYRLDKK